MAPAVESSARRVAASWGVAVAALVV
ncbi:hypothetical protein Cabther_B0755 [Chloracidobacterium thermophilum B]|uniref:Uncharacterized protein n=1 Tax=Chloracidobacterium thermophilum (strain B) TaxID=981222 RepID=G2LL76_CHLTF|nr:hypothetical protein Cabther_B0755 [Chloracidobacterium thermophilum B]